MNVENLRRDVPQFDTPELDQQWLETLAFLTHIGELGVRCAMGIETRRMLFKVIRAMGAKDVLDIGTYTGTSAVLFALAVGDGGHVTTVDIQDANDPRRGYWRKAKRRRTPAQLMNVAGVSERVRFVKQDSVEFLKSTTETYDFISIDGWHEHFCVYAEIELAVTRLKPNGLIFMDDVQPPGYVPPRGNDVIRGPWKAIHRHLDEGAPLQVTPLSLEPKRESLACAFVTRA